MPAGFLRVSPPAGPAESGRSSGSRVAPESPQQVGDDPAPVSGGGAHIVDGLDLGFRDGGGSLDPGSVSQRPFGPGKPYHRRGNAPERDPRRGSPHRRHHHFGDRLGGAGADLAKPLSALDRPDLDRGDQLVGTAEALPVPGVESGERNPALV